MRTSVEQKVIRFLTTFQISRQMNEIQFDTKKNPLFSSTIEFSIILCFINFKIPTPRAKKKTLNIVVPLLSSYIFMDGDGVAN